MTFSGTLAAAGAPAAKRAAEWAVADASADVDPVLLDLHSAATAMTELTPCQITVESLTLQDQARRQALDDAGQAGAVRLPCGYETEPHGP